jgi:hypothetical protein
MTTARTTESPRKHARVCRLIVATAALMLSLAAIPPRVSAQRVFTQDRARVLRVYVDVGGRVAVQLEGGFPRAVAARECPTNNGWAGTPGASPAMQATLTSAYLSGRPVTVTTVGCTAGGAWFNVTDVYLE